MESNLGLVRRKAKANEKVSRLIFDISRLSEALDDEPQYEEYWQPKLARLLECVIWQYERELKDITS